MSIERAAQELTAKCVSSMVFYHNSHRSPYGKTLMETEIRSVPAAAKALGIGEDHIVRSVEEELVARYGQEAGRRLFNEFATVYDSAVSQAAAR